MAGGGRLSEFQVRVAQTFFDLKASDGFVVAGGAALLASDLIVRATQDIDLDVLAQLMRTIVRFDDDEVPLETGSVTSAREFFESWSANPSNRQQ